ncbi:MAG: hypothetical protein SFV53_02960 [Rickettsiales bacterium]|nr:hypothetical protein [Rickettsiales bacterium]
MLKLQEIVESVQKLAEGLDENRKKQLENDLKKANFDQQLSTQEKVDIIFSLISFLIKTRLSENVSNIKQDLIQFLEENSDIIECENYLAPTQESKDVKELNKNNSHSLLFKLFAINPTSFSYDIILKIISKTTNLSNRQDLIAIIILDRTISSDPDMFEIFDALVERGLPIPEDDQMKSLMEDSRLSSGSNAAKLAVSFFEFKENDSLVKYITNFQYDLALNRSYSPNPSNPSTPRSRLIGSSGKSSAGILSGINRQKKDLGNFLATHKVTNQKSFIRRIESLIEMNSDESLRLLFENHAQYQYILGISDHTKILNLAVDRKLTKTFKILIEAGFDPMKHAESAINSFVYACQTQGRAPLKTYLAAIKEKFGASKVKDVINEKDLNGNDIISYTISGRSYLDTILLLKEQGADFGANYLAHLKLASQKKHAGTFDFLLRRKLLSETEILQIYQESIETNDDYVINSVFLEYIESKPTKEKSEAIQNIIKTLKEKITQETTEVEKKDIFRICQTSGKKALGYFLKAIEKRIPNYKLSNHVNDLDENQKTPLYYAISNNAFNDLVLELLQNNADPNNIEVDDNKETTDAVSLAISFKESETLRIILKSKVTKISKETINKAAYKLNKNENKNSLIISAFIESLDEEQIGEITSGNKENIFEACLECGLLDCALKIKNSIEEDSTEKDSKLINLIKRNIESGNLTILKNLLALNLDLGTLKKQKLPDPSPSNLSREDARLIKENSLLDLAIAKALNARESTSTSNQTNSASAREIVQLLLDNGFESLGDQNELKQNLANLEITQKPSSSITSSIYRLLNDCFRPMFYPRS